MTNEDYKMLMKQYWLEDAAVKYPSIISNEYKKLYSMVMDNEIYGSIMQIKDIFELILKIPVIILINGIHREIIYSPESVNDSMKQVINNFFSSKLSFGDWEKQVSLILKANKKEAFVWNENRELYSKTLDILSPLKKNYKIYGESISHWRNNTIGHGALAFKEDEAFYRDFQELLKTLQTLLSVCSEYYSQLKIYLKEKEQPYKIICIEGYQNEVEIHPYWIHHTDHLYLFDSFSCYNNKAYILNYSHGYKQPYYPLSNHIIDLHNRLGIFTATTSDTSIHKANLMSEDIEKIDRLLTRNNLLVPENLIQWLSSSVSKYPKGVFLLEAEKGIGKSTFTKMIDPLDIHNYNYNIEDFEDSIIRVWHFNDLYNSRKDIFYYNLPEILRTIGIDPYTGYRNQFIGEIQTQLSEYIHLMENCPTWEKSKYFAKMLNLVFEAYQEQDDEKEKMIVILDGIDEINPDTFEDIMAVIPSADQLQEGIYLLLTCRTQKELLNHPHMNTWRAKQNFTTYCKYTSKEFVQSVNGREIHSDNMDYLNMLKEYATKYILCHAKSYEESDIECLLQKSEYRFLYLYAYELIYQSARQDTFTDQKLTISNYLKLLQEISGEKYYHKALRLLTILAMTPTPLRMDELLYLYGEPQMTFQLYGVLTDLRCFIETNNTSKGIVLSLTHAEWKEELQSCAASIEEWERIKTYCKEQWDELYFAIQNQGAFLLLHKEYANEFWLFLNIKDILYKELAIPDFIHTCEEDALYQQALLNEKSFVHRFLKQYSEIIRNLFKNHEQLCKELLSHSWDHFLDYLRNLCQGTNLLMSSYEIASDYENSNEIMLLNANFLKTLTNQITQKNTVTQDQLMEYKLILYHYYMQINCDMEGYPIAEELYHYNLKKHGPNSEITDYSAYLLIHAYGRSGQFKEAYAFFRNIYDEHKVNQRLDSPMLANCIEAVHSSMMELPDKEKEIMELIELGYQIRKDTDGADSPGTVRLLVILAFSYYNYADVCTDQKQKLSLMEKAKQTMVEAYRKPINLLSKFEIESTFRKKGWDGLM